MELIFGYLLLILIGGPVVFALAGACAVRWLGHNRGDVFADWYVTRELLVRCLPWVEVQEPEKYPMPPSDVIKKNFPNLYAKCWDIRTNSIRQPRQGWLPSGEEVQP